MLRSLSRPRLAPTPEQPVRPNPVLVDGEIHFVVEEVLDSKIWKHRNCTLWYHIRWAGYTVPTWVSALEMNYAKDAVAEFHALNPDLPGPFKPHRHLKDYKSASSRGSRGLSNNRASTPASGMQGTARGMSSLSSGSGAP